MGEFSKEAEERLLQAVRKVVGCVEDGGLSPTDAVVKVAADMRLPQTYLPLVCQAYNQGQAAAQRESCDRGDVLCKVAEFPIARIEDVVEALYPSNVQSPGEIIEKTAVSEEYARPPASRTPIRAPRTAEKQAAAKPPAKTPRAKSAAAVRLAAEEARRRASVAQDRFLDALDTVAGYFKQAAHNRLPFAEVEFAASRLFGPAGSAALDFAYAAARLREKRAAAGEVPSSCREADAQAAPYRLIGDAVAAGEEALAAYRRLLPQEKAAEAKRQETLRPFAVKEGVGMMGWTLGSTTGTFLGNQLRQAIAQKPTPELVDDAALAFDAPGHTNELRQIQAQAMLSDLIRNDEVISGYEPDEVIDAYNEISAMSPRAAVQPVIMRSLLRKRLTGGAVEPFEAGQLAEIEKTIAQTSESGAKTYGNILNKPSAPAGSLLA